MVSGKSGVDMSTPVHPVAIDAPAADVGLLLTEIRSESLEIKRRV